MVNETEVRALIIKQTRRKLLELLKMWYPGSPSYDEIRLTAPDVEDRHLKIDLSYLCDKEYAEWVNERPNMAWGRREFRLTAKGVEVVDYIANDPAL